MSDTRSLPNAKQMSDAEWETRVDLACAYRLFHHLGWDFMIYNHISARVPDEPDQFLINPFGLLYREVTASNLVKIDMDGNILDGSPHPVNPAGFIVHSAVHAGREDVHWVMHTHTNEGLAVACQKAGLLSISFSAFFYEGGISYHDFEGITLDREECARLGASLGSNYVMILRNHGLLSCGATVGQAYTELFNLQRACEVQVMAQAGGSELITPAKEIAARSAAQYQAYGRDGGEQELMWGAMRRWMEDISPGFDR